LAKAHLDIEALEIGLGVTQSPRKAGAMRSHACSSADRSARAGPESSNPDFLGDH
jgi:hypothetical protein